MTEPSRGPDGTSEGVLGARVRRGDVDDVVRKLDRVRELIQDARESLRSDDAVNRSLLEEAEAHVRLLLEPSTTATKTGDDDS